MYRRDIINSQRYSDSLAELDYQPDAIREFLTEQDQLVADARERAAERAAAAELDPTRSVSKAQLDRLYRRGIVTSNDYNNALADLGYDAEDVTRFSTEQDEILADSRAAEALREAEAAETTPRLQSKGQLDRLYQRDILTVTQYRSALADLGYQADAIAQFQAEIDQVLAERRELAQVRAAEAANVPTRLAGKSQLDRLYRRGIVNRAGYQLSMSELDYDDATIAQFLAEQDQLIAEAIPEPEEARLPSRSELDRFYLAGLLSESNYRAGLGALDFSPASIDLFVQLAGELTADEPPLDAKLPTRAELDRFVVSGLITEASYTAGLASLGFDDEVSALFLGLIREKIAKNAEQA